MPDIGKDRDRQSSPRKRVPRAIRMFVFPDAHLLDISGPMSLFASANELAGYHAYDVALIARQAGPTRSSAGIDLVEG